MLNNTSFHEESLNKKGKGETSDGANMSHNKGMWPEAKWPNLILDEI